MEIIEYPFIWEWCREHGVSLEESGNQPPRLITDPALAYRSRLVFAPQGPSGYEPAVASAILDVLGSWDECLLWITAWGIWPSSEDWPKCYELRARHGPRMSIDNAPGHVAGSDEQAELLDLLLQVLENGWDATLVPAQRGKAAPVRVLISHDGWAMVEAAEPLALSVPGLTPTAV